MRKQDTKKLKVTIGKKALAAVRDDELKKVSGSAAPLCFESPPPTFG